jgi:hypothetical protein
VLVALVLVSVMAVLSLEGGVDGGWLAYMWVTGIVGWCVDDGECRWVGDDVCCAVEWMAVGWHSCG